MSEDEGNANFEEVEINPGEDTATLILICGGGVTTVAGRDSKMGNLFSERTFSI